MSLEAAAALICKLGCFTELLQSSALAKVPTDLQRNRILSHKMFLLTIIHGGTTLAAQVGAVNKRLLPTSVTHVQIPYSLSHVGRVCCRFSTRVFL